MRRLISFFLGLVQPLFFLWCPCLGWHIGKILSEKLQKLQNRVARVITRSSYDIFSCSLLDELNWDTLPTMRLKQKANLMFNTINETYSTLSTTDVFSQRECL